MFPWLPLASELNKTPLSESEYPGLAVDIVSRRPSALQSDKVYQSEIIHLWIYTYVLKLWEEVKWELIFFVEDVSQMQKYKVSLARDDF